LPPVAGGAPPLVALVRDLDRVLADRARRQVPGRPAAAERLRAGIPERPRHRGGDVRRRGDLHLGPGRSRPIGAARHPGGGSRDDGAGWLGAGGPPRPLAHRRARRLPPRRRLRRRRRVVGERSARARPRRARARRLIRLAAGAGRAALAALLLAACGPPSPPPGKPTIVASAYPVEELTRQVAGDAAQVVGLVPPGAEPHDWEPSPQDLTRIKRSAAFVYNGGGLEPWVPKLLA